MNSKEVKSATNTPRKRVLRSVAEKKALVAQLEAGALQNELAREHKIAVSCLVEWTKKYGSASFLATKYQRHALNEVVPIVRAIREGRLSIKEAAIQNKVHFVTVKSWIKKYELQETRLLSTHPTQLAPVDPSDTESQLRKELEAARLKIRALETMIEVAENDLNIPIRKKPGAKQ